MSEEASLQASKPDYPIAEAMYVAWCDVMGSGSMMIHNFRVARYRVYQFHWHVLRRSRSATNVRVVPISDGAFLLSNNLNDILQFVSHLYRDIRDSGNKKDLRSRPDLRFLARCGIAYGGVSIGDVHYAGLHIEEPGFNEHYRNVVVGPAVSLAYNSESMAAPLGIYLDRSVLQSSSLISTDSAQLTPFYRWFDKVEGQRVFGDTVRPYFDLLLRRTHEYGIPASKIDSFLALAGQNG